ncbi:hypothetical protein KFU94_47105 [Chloroflexi bacterium TSY]|nr:hypothetical protein [Chloroflexi bacterium TSY]
MRRYVNIFVIVSVSMGIALVAQLQRAQAGRSVSGIVVPPLTFQTSTDGAADLVENTAFSMDSEGSISATTSNLVITTVELPESQVRITHVNPETQ